VTTASPPTAPAGADLRLPRWLLVLGVPLAGVVLVAFFVFLRFPFDRFSDVLAAQAGRALGAEVVIGDLEPALTVGGPGFVARNVLVRWPGGERATVAEARLRPAWSLSWLGLSPAFRLDADSDLGGVAGRVTVGEAPGFARDLGASRAPMSASPQRLDPSVVSVISIWLCARTTAGFDGRLEGVALARLPLTRFTQGASLDGRLDLETDLRLREGAPVGDATFRASDGSLALAQLPVALPFTALHGTLRFADDGAVALELEALEGPMVSGEVRGGTQPGPSPWLAPLELDVRLQVSDRTLPPAFRSAGLRLAPDGSADLRVRGTLSAPIVR